MVDGLVGDFVGRCLGWVKGFVGSVWDSRVFLWDAGFFLPFFWIFLDFFLLCSGGSGVLSHGAGSGLGFHG